MAKIALELLVERLADWGVDTIFGLPGDGINGITEGCVAIRTASGSCWCITRKPPRSWRPATRRAPAGSACVSRRRVPAGSIC